MKSEERWREHKYKLHAPRTNHKHWVLEYARKRRSGKYGKYEKWPLRLTTPPWIFKWLLKRTKDLHKQLHDSDRTYHKEFPKIIDVLIRNGEAQGFHAKKTDRDYGDVTWYCHDKPFATIMVADMSNAKQLWGQASDVAKKVRESNVEGHRFRKMERKSHAPIRLVWAVSCNGKWFRLGIGKMRTKSH